MAKTSTRQTEDEELKEHRQLMAALLGEAHTIAVKQFGANVSPMISSQLFGYMTDDEDLNTELAVDLGKAATLSVEIYGEAGKTPEVVLSVLEDVYGFDEDED